MTEPITEKDIAKELVRIYDELVTNQADMSESVRSVLYSDLWNLYESQMKSLNDVANERMLFFLSHLKSEFGIGMKESIRKGVALFFMAKQEEKKGRRLAFIDDDNNVVVELNSL